MAKSKHSTALFEVINKSSRPEQAAQSLRTPKWWFKGYQTPKPAPAEAPSFSEPTASAAPPTPLARRASGVTRLNDPSSRHDDRDSESDPAGRSTVHVAFDRQQQKLTLQMRYTTALAGSFLLCALIGAAYVIGRHLSHGPQSASASEQPHFDPLLRQPPQPGVTDIARGHTGKQPVPTTVEPVREAARPGGTQPPAVNPPAAITANIVSGLPRTVGWNYVVIQSYPPQEAQAAQAAKEYLTRNTLPCTIERIPDYNPRQGWVCLIGTAGFTKVHSTEFESYLQTIRALADKYQTSRFDRFDPHPYKWKGQ